MRLLSFIADELPGAATAIVAAYEEVPEAKRTLGAGSSRTPKNMLAECVTMLAGTAEMLRTR